MRHAAALILIATMLAACNRPVSEEAGTVASPTASATAAATTAAPAAFDPASVPESTVALPPFPLLKPLDGLSNILGEAKAMTAFDREWFVAGDKLLSAEGKVFRGEYNLTLERPYSALEFLRNHEAAITQLGGRKIAGPLSTNPFRQDLAKLGAKPTSHCMIDPCDETEFYLLRQQGKEWWITVGTGSFPLHGYVVVLEKGTMAKSFSFMDVSALKTELDAKGRVPVYIEFDTDRASLRPDARPAVDEIIKLMQAHTQLKLSIEGHTDDIGQAARNQPLSLARAETVRAELIAAGIAPARMKTAGFGSSRPLAQGTDADARARNRRVELVKF